MRFIATRYFWRAGLLTMLLIVLGHAQVNATHLRAGEITVRRASCNSLQFIITITVYTNTKNTTVLFGGEQDILDFGDGVFVKVPETPNTVRTDLNPDGSVATASYTISHTFPGPGQYVISYREPNRNEGVLNMDASVNTTFYLETLINIDPFLGCNDTPILSVPPIDNACPGVAWSHNPGARDPNFVQFKDSLSYELVVPFSDRNTEVINYRDPNDRGFYTNYNTANENGTGPPTFSIDPRDGTLTWDAPGAIGEYNIAFHIIEWRKINGEWYRLGYVRRDMQILVEDCDNERPQLILPPDTCVVAGTRLEATIIGLDPDNDNVKIEAFSPIFDVSQSPATYSPVPGPESFRPVPAETKFVWDTECLHVSDQPYQVIFKITDDPENGPRLVTFESWFIKVVGPAPEWNDIQLDVSKRRANLAWDPYSCQNAETMQVWRKIDGSDFTPDNCETGMPSYLGYELIGEVPIENVNSFIDTNGGRGLAPGAKYCYRLVAVFPALTGGESYVSRDTCIGPILADVPIITNVSVLQTNTTEGRIKVTWMSPFEADPTQFPPPYVYDVYRAIGFNRGADSVLVQQGLSDTTFVDEGLNTEDNIYNYSVLARSGNNQLGSSAPASSVRLGAESQLQKIQLSWSASVPWSNQITRHPMHLIYRGEEGTPEEDLVLIDSVDVTAQGFTFLDEGQHGALQDGQTYCYKILTRGGYGNEKIPEPLLNFSQVICAQPGDTIPPCKPVLNVQMLDCEKFLNSADRCGENVFTNTIYWEKVREGSCDTNILGYKVYRSGSIEGEYVWLDKIGINGIVRDTFFVDNTIGATSAYCYKIAAVDRSGNESELSDAACNDNCPYYELPNIFTPNGDGCNDLFSAYSNREIVGEDGEVQQNCQLVESKKKDCARFVERVEFKVYNRWGKEVYAYEGGAGAGENTIYIDWNGKDDNNSDLATGVYYYIAQVTFDIISPQKTKVLKGWVHLMR